MADDLFSIKNEFYLGNYMGAINEAQSGDLELSTPADERDRDVIIYRSYLALGQYDKALQAAGGGARQKEALYEMGAICEAQGQREDALRHFTKILEQDIGFRDVAQKVEALKG